MYKEFIILPEFDKQWKAINLTDDDLRRLEDLILENPELGDVMQGTGGLRKLRFSFSDRGKSGSSRVCYINIVRKEKIFLITAYPKNVKDNLSKAERNNIKQLVEILKSSV
ncbi:type II toxin-antitoxin system RelE/ParE family toxin [uncultured Phascolarctobacterium sp.]|jgi:mRNA-degrading endonuclease RelE of RelBE toxin-antitoxin system|uniref:type II toxin-antitoxin system RelE/ParE family toxin n=1 Tax=uncultured Phascolarctobacterium sp. TaxID=512296 RepID=UPI0025CE358A|nr:type II toxin-antitoxin system RelE/ParE family toxin [uncultured Phascolarctobacterium sp.]